MLGKSRKEKVRLKFAVFLVLDNFEGSLFKGQTEGRTVCRSVSTLSLFTNTLYFSFSLSIILTLNSFQLFPQNIHIFQFFPIIQRLINY
jgi:hypothetical protein